MTGIENSTARRRLQIVIVVVLLLAAFALRYAVAGRAIWFDERFTVINTESVRAAVDHCLRYDHPPLYFVLLAQWRTVFSPTEFSMRILSLIFGMISLAGIYLAGRAVAGRNAGIAALAIAVFAPYHWLFSTELRPYAMFMAFSAFSTWAFLRILKTGRLKYFMLLAVFTALNLYTHYFSIFLPAAQAVVFLLIALRNSTTGRWTSSYRNRQILYGVLILAIVAVAYAPWVNVLRRIITQSVAEGHVVGPGSRVGRGVTLSLITRSFFDSMGEGLIPFLLQAALVALALSDKKHRSASLLFLVTWILPFILLKIWKPAHFIDAKYFIFAYPITVAMAGTGLVSAAECGRRTRVRAAHAFCILLLVVSLSPLLPGQHKPYWFHQSDWGDSGRRVGGRPPKTVTG